MPMLGEPTEAVARQVRQWVQAHAVVPDGLRRLWQHPSLGYLVAVLGQVAAVSLTLYLRDMWPRGFPYHGLLPLVVVIAVALRWDLGPSALATLVGAALVDYYVLPPYATWSHGSAQMGAVLAFVAIGLTIGILGSRAQHARLRAQAATARERQQREKAETAVCMRDEVLNLATHD